jgi:hypothetical protein
MLTLSKYKCIPTITRVWEVGRGGKFVISYHFEMIDFIEFDKDVCLSLFKCTLGARTLHLKKTPLPFFVFDVMLV